uniref:sensor histidine kinase n=1 Tax=Gorillibacterium timonense TaxID=1689269 RepID=UPI00071CEC04|nr:HAMP domain-containing sensor histidine kinase [Gorillibacterium timonense]
MFTKLRNRFLLVNLVSITILMLVAFTSIYTITYRDAYNETNRELHRLTEFYQKVPGGRDTVPPSSLTGNTDPSLGAQTGNTDQLPAGKNGGQALNPASDLRPADKGEGPPERSVSFQVLADKSRTLTQTSSALDLDQDQEFYETALQKAISAKKDIGQFTLDETRWAYIVQPTRDGYQYVFLDVSAQQAILTKLIYTFSAVGLAMLLVIYGISRFFANRSIAPIREAFEKQKQFIADASHELKTPLAIISTNADVLLANENEPIRQQAKWLHYIKSETERMSRLTNDLLYLTELDDSRTAMIFSPFDLSESVESIILTMEAVIFEKHLSLTYDIEPNLMVNGSNEQIKQVILILLDNAIKYTNPNGTVTVSLKKQSHGVLLSVSNTGEGIAPEHLARIFDRFYRTDASRTRKQGGYGLGLAIAKSIVEQHKGRIYAKSVVGESTTFSVQLS